MRAPVARRRRPAAARGLMALSMALVAALLAAQLVMQAAGCARGKPPGLGPTPRFVDVTAASGLPGAGQTSGAVLVDLDGDGRRDLLLGRHATLPEAYRNLGDLRFERVPAWGAGLDVFDHHATLADDLDGDGNVDFYFVVGAHRGVGVGNNVLWLSSQRAAVDAAADWGVQDPYGRGRGAVMLDVEGDGARELLVLNFKTAMRAYRLQPPGPMVDRVGELFGLQPADDTAVADTVQQGRGSQAVRRRSDWAMEMLPQDLNADGRLDALLSGGFPVEIVRFASGRLKPDLLFLPPEASTRPPASAVWGDFDDDGRPDLYLVYGEDDAGREAELPRRNRLLTWPRGHVVDAADTLLAMRGWGLRCAAADLDNNGTLDLVVQQSHRASRRTRARLVLNEGRARFVPLSGPSSMGGDQPGIADGIIAADLDGDGDLDLLLLQGAVDATDAGGGVRLLGNDLLPGASAAHWLEILLDGAGRCVPYGARIEIMAGGRRQYRQYWPCLVSGSAFAAPQHVGLGKAVRVDELTVRWPTGQVTSLRDQAADRTIVVRHP